MKEFNGRNKKKMAKGLLQMCTDSRRKQGSQEVERNGGRDERLLDEEHPDSKRHPENETEQAGKACLRAVVEAISKWIWRLLMMARDSKMLKEPFLFFIKFVKILFGSKI